MPHSFKLSRRIARLRAPMLAALALAFGACESADSFDPGNSTPPNTIDQTSATGDGTDGAALDPVDAPALAVSYSGGMPIGMFRQPISEWGSRFNGGYRRMDPSTTVSDLSAIKSRGGKVVLMLAGAENYYKDADGHFSFTKWKARIDRFKNINFSSYIKDGTVIGHYMIDEPQDPANWNGTRVSQSTLDAMAKYSKQLWPGMVTIVRSTPDYLAAYSGTYQYLDASWGQYLIFRWPDVSAWISSNVSKSKSKGLALIVGMNVIDGGSKKGTPMTASQIKSYGSAILNNSYPCAFVSWQYRDSYMTSSVKDAMSYLRSKANNLNFKTCRGS